MMTLAPLAFEAVSIRLSAIGTKQPISPAMKTLKADR
jgi:hypothetical protein